MKDPESIYSPGRRGMFWFKLKKELATLDVVVVAVETRPRQAQSRLERLHIRGARRGDRPTVHIGKPTAVDRCWSPS